jgi:hypothetical protein
MIALLSWSSWLIAIVIGLAVFIMRSAETGLTYINLPGFLYYIWIMACALILAYLRAPVPAALAIGVAVVVGVWAVLGEEPVRGSRHTEVVERIKGCQRALKADKRNPASLELLGDVYSTLENKELALKYWGLAYEIWARAKLLEKIESVKRADPVFFIWGSSCANELRACPTCERAGSRLEFSCPRCGEVFYPGRASWVSVRFNRVYETTVAGPAVEMGLLFLPFLFFCEPWAYAAAWLVWIGARRPAPPEVV